MKRACAGLVGSAVLTATLAVTPSANAYDPGTSADFFGVNGAVLRNFVNPDKAATLEGLATSMGGQGISWTRITFDQAVDEKEKGVFNWYAEDQMVAALARHGVRGAASFVGTATWAADPAMYGTCPWGRAYPHDLDGWTTWVAAAARRYGSTGGFWILHPELPKLPIRTWEIGNEVNSAAFWCPGANPEQYAQVYSASSDAIKAVDPTAKVIVAGLAARFGPQSGGNLDVDSFLSRMTAADPSLRTRIDAVGIHPYAGTVDGALYRVSLYRQAMAAAGMPSTPMLANEIGWYTQGPDGLLKATEEQRAGLIEGVANRFWRTDCGVSGLAPYSWITMEQNTGSAEDWFGLADAVSGAPHPSGVAYGDQIRLALGQGAQPPTTEVLKICHPDRTLTVQNGGGGTVTSSPTGISCGTSCTVVVADGAQVTLTATSAAGYAFRAWSGCDSVSGNQCTVKLTSDRTVRPTFVARWTLTVQKTGSGTVTSSPAGISCGADCTEVADNGTTFVLTATPAAGSSLGSWIGCDSVSANQCTVTMNASRTVTAKFAATKKKARISKAKRKRKRGLR